MSRRCALSKPLILHARSPGQRFAAGFLQIPPCGEHSCLKLWLLVPSPSEAFTPQTAIMPRTQKPGRSSQAKRPRIGGSKCLRRAKRA